MKDKPDFSYTHKLIRERMAVEAIPSLSIAVARRGEILWEEGFGWADREYRVPATEHTPYYLASVSKSITATAIMLLHERRMLSLDSPVNAYLGTAQVSSPHWNSAEVTVRQIAMHTSGLTTFARTCYDAQPDFRISADETIQRYGIAFWEPGDRFDYSNLNYGILGEVVSHVSKKPFADFLRTEIFLPLGMNQTSLGIPPSLEKEAAVRYSSDYGRRDGAVSATPGASLIYSSVHDLALFAMLHLKSLQPNQKAILPNASLDAMQEQTVEVGDGSQYGMGWWVNKNYNGFRAVLAQGGTDDASAWMQLVPSEGIAVIVLVNTGSGLPSEVIEETLATMLPAFREKRTNTSQSDLSPKKNAPAPAFVGQWMGTIRTYCKNIPLILQIADTGEISANLGTQLRTPLANVRFEPQRLCGNMAGDLEVEEDTGSEPYDLDVELYLAGDTLYGAVTTSPRSSRHQFARLSYWVELTPLPQ
jgi:CubicO group peptidase (beta-lactamase class C family)